MPKGPVFESLLARRSTRSFREEKVSREDIETLLEAAMAAPSSCNLQPWSFVVVDEEETLAQLKAVSPLGQYNAPLAILICGETNHLSWKGGWQFDCGAAAQSMMVEAVELGLASVCVGGFDGAAAARLLHIPEGVQPCVIIELGYPAEEKVPHSWYDPKAVHWQQYQADNGRVMRTVDMLKKDMDSGLC